MWGALGCRREISVKHQVRAQWGRIGNQSTLILPTMLHSGANTMHHPKCPDGLVLAAPLPCNLPTQVP